MKEKIIKILVVICYLGFFQAIEVKAQIQTDTLMLKAEELARQIFYRSHDSVYIRSYADELAVRVTALNKSNFFRVIDGNENSSLRYRPDRRISLGFGASYKWFSLGVSFNVGFLEKEQFDNSKFFDFSGTVFSIKHFVGVSYQYYLGYKLTGGLINDTEIPESSKFREDIRTIHFGLNYLYAFNHGKFSLKAPFALNQIQRKNAGSVVAGASFTINVLDGDSTLIPQEFYNDFDERLLFKDLNVTTLGVNVGYLYSFVWKEQLFLTLGLIPGLNFVSGDYQTDYRNTIPLHLYPKFQILSSLGLNKRRYFIAIQFQSSSEYIRIDKKLRIELGRGKVTFLVGYRFGNKKGKK